MFEAFTEAEEMFDMRLAEADVYLTDALTNFYESCLDSTFYEKQGDSLGVKINKFIANMVTAVIEFVNSIKLQINTMLESSAYQKKLRTLHKTLNQHKANGAKTVKVQDVWSLTDVYLEGVSKLKKYSKKFAKMNYKTTAKLNEDLEEFNRIYDEYDQKAKKALDKTTVVSIDKMLAFIDAECSGNGRVMKTLEDSAIEFKEMGNAAMALSKKADILGPDIIQKHVGFIKRQMMKISEFMKKIIVKIVLTACIVVG